jgi:triosephosphate isomerase (TIM)
MRRKLVVANWKMHGSLEQNKLLLDSFKAHLNELTHVDVVICVPYPYLHQAQQILAGSAIAWGAQNVGKFSVGPYTGEVAASMLQDFGANFVILGHSERSTAYCESAENVAAKFMTAKNAGITPILCVGETLIEREAGVMDRVVSEQLDPILNLHGADIFKNAVISYEPIWAIGTGLSASPEQAQTMIAFIRNKLEKLSPSAAESVRIIYGGSVNPINASKLMVMQDVDGGLVGKCSLVATDFEKICFAADEAASI